MSETDKMDMQESLRLASEPIQRHVAELTAERDRLRAELSETRAFLESVEQRFLRLFLNVPAGVLVLRPPEMVAELANERYLAMIGNRDILGKRLDDALPELREQGVVDRLTQVYASGEPFFGREQTFQVDVDGSGQLAERWYNFVWQPVRGTRGEVASILCHVADVTDEVLARRKVEELNGELRIFKRLVDTALDGVGIINTEGTMTYVNAAFGAMTGLGDRAVGMSLAALYDPEVLATTVQEALIAIEETGSWSGTLPVRRPDGSTWMAQLSANLLTSAEGERIGNTGVFRDVTAQLRLEQERAELHERLIEAQQEALRELATPLIPLARGVLAMPLVGTIDADRARQILETLLQGIASQRARVAILDVTGVRRMDAQIAGALVQSAKAAQLLGAEVVLTGLSPDVARTLVELGVDLSGIQTSGSFQAGIAYALARLRSAGS